MNLNKPRKRMINVNLKWCMDEPCAIQLTRHFSNSKEFISFFHIIYLVIGGNINIEMTKNARIFKEEVLRIPNFAK